jgi:glutamate--cysteine ligase
VGPGSLRLFADHVARGCKPRRSWTTGVEIELIGYERDTLERAGRTAVEGVLADFVALGAEPAYDCGRQIEARFPWGWVTIEPGGQVEFSGASRAGLAEVERDLGEFLSHLAGIAKSRDLHFVACGFDPLRSADEQRWFPKSRYEVMRPYLGSGTRKGWDMMCRTGAIQANVDYGSAEDLAAKFVVGNRLGPITAAMFANSPFESGRLSGFKSRRYAAWLHTDRDRTGVSPASLTDAFSIASFVDYVVRVPMFFVRRGGAYVDLAGYSFERFLAEGAGGERAIFQDFTDHLTTIFTEARLKQHVELRSADAGPAESVLAFQAFWKGIAYDEDALGQALALAPRLDGPGFRRLQEAVARDGLAAAAEGVRVLDVAREAVRLAAAGLARVAPDESRYLDPLVERVVDGVCPADLLIRDFEGPWGGRIAPALQCMRVA